MRAVGIHFVLSTQIPKSEVLTGLIKGNMPCRIGFSVPNIHASMAILDNASAAGLSPVGRCIFQFRGEYQVQTPFISKSFIAQTIKGSIDGNYGEASKHDLTPAEVMEWALDNNNGWLQFHVLYNRYKTRGISQEELSDWLQSWEGQEFPIKAGSYVVEPGAGTRGRRLIALSEDTQTAPEVFTNE
jgi:hypothetical protein